MVRRRSATADGYSMTVSQRRERHSITGSNSELTVADDDCADDHDALKLEPKSAECGLREKAAEKRTPIIMGTPASSVSLKRRHTPNTLYANDFVFQSIKKAKVSKLETGFGLEQSSAKIDLSDMEQDKADKPVSFASDQTTDNSHNCSAKKRGRKPKFCNKALSREVENVKSGNFSSSLNLSPRCAHTKLGEKANMTGRKKPHLPNELLSIDFNSAADRTEVPLTAPRKRGRPRKNLAGEIFLEAEKQDVKHNSHSFSVNSSQMDTLPSLCKNVSIPRNRTSSMKNMSLQDEHFRTGFRCYSGEAEPSSYGQRTRRSNYGNVQKSCDELLNNDFNLSKSGPAEVLFSVPRKPAEADFTCSHCSETFSSDYYIKSHMARRHHLIVS